MPEQNYSNWAVGWAAFAGVILIISGVFHFIAGLTAIVDDDFYVRINDYVFEFSTTTWGWIHLIVGIIVFLAGIGLFTGQVWARIVGVIAAAISVIDNFAWLPYYPVWSAIMIAVGIAVIWALTAHGEDLATSQQPG